MTSGNKEGLEALSPEGKLFPIKAKEHRNLLSLDIAGGSQTLSRYQWQSSGVWLEKRSAFSRLSREGIFKIYSLNFQIYNYC